MQNLMEKLFVEIFNLLAIAAIFSFPFLKTKGRGILTLSVISIQVVISSIVALSVFANGGAEYFYPGSWITGEIPIRIDYLSAWFMLIISFTFLTGAWYGFQYLKKYKNQSANIALSRNCIYPCLHSPYRYLHNSERICLACDMGGYGTKLVYCHYF